MSNDHPPVRSERSHPLIWTVAMFLFIAVVAWWFANQFIRGALAGRNHPLPPAEATKGYAGPDHAAMIAELLEPAGATAALKLAKQRFGTCVTCHGVDGRLGANNARKWGVEPFKNGTDLYSMYQTITRGYGQMAAQVKATNDDAAREAYALAFYVMENFLKEAEIPDQYNPVTEDYLASKPWGTAAATAVATDIDPLELKNRPLAIPVEGVMIERSLQAAAATARHDARRSLLRAAEAWPDQRIARQLTALGRDPHQGELQRELVEAALAGDRERFLTSAASPPALRSAPALVLLSGDELQTLFAQVVAATTAGKDQ